MTETTYRHTITDGELQTMLAHGCTVIELSNGETVLLEEGWTNGS